MAQDFYQLSSKTLAGENFDFSQLKGKVVLIVNTASKCGFTAQYQGLENLHKTYQDQGLVVLGFPCNQFGGQEPGDSSEIADFCQVNYGMSFGIMEKIDVNGQDTHPVYQFLKSQKTGILGSTGIKWNFTKFLVGKDGQVIDRYAPQKKPEDLVATIEKALGA